MKAKGFTLLELLFCMALMGIVLSFGGWVYQVFQGFQYRYLAQVERTYELIHLQDRLQKDFAQAKVLEPISPGCFQLLDSKNEQEVLYCFSEGFLTRSHQTHIDTFNIKASWEIRGESLSLQERDTELHFSFHLPPHSRAQKLTTHKFSNYEGN